jgi:hypothetical protein
MPGYGYPGHATPMPPTGQLYGLWKPEASYGSTRRWEEGAEHTKDGLAHLPLNPERSSLQIARERLDLRAIFISTIVPCIVFAAVAAVMCSHLRYGDHWPFAFIIALACLLPAIGAESLARWARKAGDEPQNKWMLFVSAMCAFAWLSGLVVGMVNFTTNMQPYYDILNLNYYPSVDPSTSGESTIDAGRLLFVDGSKLDFSKAMGVRVSKTYCVVPVINTNAKSSDSEYDYWAVGVDCCSSTQPQVDFNCPMVHDYHASAAMRSMDDDSRPFFRMAVQEAEATYKIQAKHPIFLKWMMDPAHQLASWRARASRMFFKFTFSFIVFTAFIAMSMGLFMSSLYMESRACKGTGFHKYTRENPDHDPLTEEGMQVVEND